MSPVKFFVRLNLDQIILFLDEHCEKMAKVILNGAQFA